MERGLVWSGQIWFLARSSIKEQKDIMVEKERAEKWTIKVYYLTHFVFFKDKYYNIGVGMISMALELNCKRIISFLRSWTHPAGSPPHAHPCFEDFDQMIPHEWTFDHCPNHDQW